MHRDFLTDSLPHAPAGHDLMISARTMDGDSGYDKDAEVDAEIDALFRVHYNALCGFVFRYVRSHETAEELVQDTFFRLWAQRKREGRIESEKAYLFTIARNSALNYIRRSQMEARWQATEITRDSRPAVADDDLAHDELEAVLRRAIEHLPKRCRLIYTMSRQQELTYVEIARVLGLSVKTVETQMGRALKALRGTVSRHFGNITALVASATILGGGLL
jgi:RNA polymerase sigma-70 factor (ECF subfamily)